MPTTRHAVCLLGLLAFLFAPGCAAVKVAGMAAKTGSAVAKVGKATATAGKAVSTAGKAAAVGKGATVAAGTVVVSDVVRLAASGDDVWRLGAAGRRAGQAGEELKFVAPASEGSTLKSVASNTLDGALNCADFAGWVEDSEPEEGRLAGEGAPRHVADAFLQATYPANPLNKAKLVKGRFWMQFYSMEQGDRLVVYDTQRKSIKILKPQ